MANTELSIREWQVNYKNGMYADTDVDTQIEAGWYDWFCKTSSLPRKTTSLGNLVAKIKDGGKVDLDTMNVWFKNNCPCTGNLYDDIRISDDEKNVLVISLNSPYEDYRYAVYSFINDYSDPVFVSDKRKEVVDWLNTPWTDEEVVVEDVEVVEKAA